MRISGLAGIVTAFVLSGSGIAAAQGSVAANGEGPGRSFVNQRRQAFRDHYGAQHKENLAFRQTLKGKTPADICGAVASHRRTQYGENKSFHADQYAKLVAFIKERMAARNVPSEKQAEVLAKIDAFRDKVAGIIDDQHEKTMDLIERLAADSDLTGEEVRSALKQRFEEARGELQAVRNQAGGRFRDRLQQRRQRAGGEGNGRLQGRGQR